MVEAMKRAKIDPALIYAYEKSGLVPTAENRDAIGPKGMAAWQAAIQEYERTRKGRVRRRS